MKKVCITYHMRNKEEIAETCTTLPITEHFANDLLTHGVTGFVYGEYIRGVLYRLSAMQGYDFDESYDPIAQEILTGEKIL